MSPAPATEVAARRLIVVADALLRSESSGVCLGEGQKWIPEWAPPARVAANHRGAPMVGQRATSRASRDALHDSTGLLITGRRLSDASVTRPIALARSTSCHPVQPSAVRIREHGAAPVAFYEYIPSWRATGPAADFSDGDIRLLDQLRPVASRLLRRAALSSLAEASASALGPRAA